MKRIIINKNLVTSEIQRYVGPIDLSEESFSKLLKISTIEKIKKHDLFLKPGDFNDYMGVVLKGMVQIYHYDKNKLVSDFFAGEGCGFFDTHSFLLGKPSEAYFEALEPTVIAKFNRKKFLEEGEKDPEIDVIYRRVLQYAITMSNDRLNSILHDSAEEKYVNLESRIPGLTSR
ncbi:MAG: cyclic nucleotide-binding domain-containing protein, partial [Paludibacteraceae bacterium]|nr:cyclic nucleotide-binding domain-containing protein [Paludibacteraceae bacterium]